MYGIYRTPGAKRYRVRIDLELPNLGVVYGHLCIPEKSFNAELASGAMQYVCPRSLARITNSHLTRRSGVTGPNVLCLRQFYPLRACLRFPREKNPPPLRKLQSGVFDSRPGSYLSFCAAKRKYPFQSAQPRIARGQ